MSASLLRLTAVACATALLVAVIAPRAAAEDKKPDEKKVELNVGDKAPAFELRTDRDTTWTSAEHVGKKWMVIYFYPGDFTPGCTAQANAFRDAMNKLTDLGVEVVGISGDSVRIHEQFKKAQKLNFTLLADEDGKVARSFGVPVGKGATVKAKDADGKPFEFERVSTAARWTFIIGKDGKIAYKNIKVIPAQDAKAVTEFITGPEKK
jgi:thioredoxin-dependent peroxiredoxin